MEQGSTERKKLRSGYTTGSCAAGAAKAAVQLLLTGKAPASVALMTPKGVPLNLDVADWVLEGDSATCAIRKDSGDDPDITNGVLVYAKVSKREGDILIDGGEGIGRVTKPGLNQPVGQAAINTVPRQMIAQACQDMAAQHGYQGGFQVMISIPGGEELAKKTFNPRLGIEGGLSVIGTTGIVEPMSNAALVDTIRLELNVLAASGAKAVLLSPGNYGETFCRDVLGLEVQHLVLCSNFIGLAVEAAVEKGFKQILLVGHIGKMVKLGIGMLNTHSNVGDGRMETLAACGIETGVELPVLQALLSCATTDAALYVLHEANCLEKTMNALKRRIQNTLSRIAPDGVELGFICFTSDARFQGILTGSDNAQRLMENFKTKREAKHG
ncbi:MAG: cobalt-precorrin-5B (C(1))-methyltransferase CbiD [Christensenellales bacterium]|jgi:cobalt-precorrin-5B (C1)-methyltransferase